MAKVQFTRKEAAFAFGSMAEGMEEVERDNDDIVTADELDKLALLIWNDLQQGDGEYPFYITIDRSIIETAEAVKENCEENAEGRNYHDDLDEDEKDECFVGECEVVSDEAEFEKFWREISPNDKGDDIVAPNDMVEALRKVIDEQAQLDVLQKLVDSGVKDPVYIARINELRANKN